MVIWGKMGSKKSRFSAKILADSYSEASPGYKYGVIDPIEYVGGEVGPHLMFRMCDTPNRSATLGQLCELAQGCVFDAPLWIRGCSVSSRTATI